jgi:hypothetical protein
MTKLHIQVNQTLQFYRGQQGGSAPQRLFLSGGASIMPYTAQFFAEKLNVPVEYFNPFRNVQIDPSVNLEELAQVAHSLGEVVGLGLRNLANCPVEMNLMPDSTLRWQAFNQKKPYFMATVFTWMEDRYYWGDLLAQFRQVLIRSEDEVKKKYIAQKPGLEVGIWIEQMTLGAATATPGDNSGSQPASGGTPGQNSAITLVCRAVDLSNLGTDFSSADNEIVYAVERELKASPVFDPKSVQPSAQISPVDANGTFTFTITVSPQNPLQL